MNFQVFKPSEELATWIECYWFLSFPSDYISREELMIPGGRVELMFNIGTHVNFTSSSGKSFELKNDMYILGQRNTFFKAQHNPGYHMWGVRFKPACFYPFCNGSTSFLLNTVAEAADIFKPLDTNAWYNRFLTLKDDAARIQLLECFLKDILYKNGHHNNQFYTLLSQLKINAEETAIAGFCNNNNLYYKKLERQFLQYAGYTPKEFLSVRRFYRSVEMIYQTNNNLTNICHQLGYYDQSHFIKDFKNYASLPPLKFVKGRFDLPKFLTAFPSV